jgi:hypothetical protein
MTDTNDSSEKASAQAALEEVKKAAEHLNLHIQKLQIIVDGVRFGVVPPTQPPPGNDI